VRTDAHRLSPTSQIGLYPGEDIASYTETPTQALEQHGWSMVSKAALRLSEMSNVGLPSSAAL